MPSAIETIYEALCSAVDRARDASDDAALERIALALANEIGDPARVRHLIEDALAAGPAAPREN